MKHKKNRILMTILSLLLVLPLLVQAQYKMDVPSIPGLTRSQPSGVNTFLGIDLSRIDFQNSYSMQVSTYGGDAVATGLLKSSFNYMINPQVSVRGFVGLVHSPFSSFAPVNEQASFINGFSSENMLYGGEVTYRPKENMVFQIGFSKQPTQTYYSNYSPYTYRPFGY